MRTTLAVLAAAIFTLIAIGPAAGGRALASVRWTGNQGQLDRSVAYLQGAQNPDGGFGGVKGAASDPLFTAWVGLGLAAAGVNPQDQRAPGGGTDMYTYLTANVPGPDADTTDVERAALVAVAATGSAHDVGGHDLAAAILARQRPDGSFPHAAGGTAGGINDTAFAILPLSAEPGLGDALARAATWLRRRPGRRRRLELRARRVGEHRHDRRGAPGAPGRAAGRARTPTRGPRPGPTCTPPSTPTAASARRRATASPTPRRPPGSSRRCGPPARTRRAGGRPDGRRWTTWPRCSRPTDRSATRARRA